MSFFTVFFQMLALLIMIGAGWIASKCGLMDQCTNDRISRLIVSIFNPLLVFSSAVNSVGQISLELLGIVGVIAAGMFLFFILVGMILTPFFDKDPAQRKLFQLMFVFSNLGFIGIPVVRSILGEQYVVYITVFMLVYTFVFYTYGITLMDGKFTAASLKKMINPGNVCSVAGLFILITNIQLPDFVLIAVSYLGNTTTPLALMAVGYTLAISEPQKVFGNVKIYIFTTIKMLLLPVSMAFILKLLPVDAELIPISVVMFGMPVGNMPLMLGTEKGIDCSTCTSAILVTTILCVVTIPIILMMA